MNRDATYRFAGGHNAREPLAAPSVFESSDLKITKLHVRAFMMGLKRDMTPRFAICVRET